MALRAWRKQRSELIQSTTSHCWASNHIFADDFVQETDRCDHLTFSGINFGLRSDTKHATKVVTM